MQIIYSAIYYLTYYTKYIQNWQ